MNQKPDFFKDAAEGWDQASIRVNNARKIASAIRHRISLESDMHLMDFGAGTGLLSEGLAPFVRKITAIDYSASMLEKFCEKEWPCETDAINIDLLQATLDFEFDGIISSMTLHHIEDIDLLFGKFRTLLKTGGFIALADLEMEDGTFHSNNAEAGVKHFGFDRNVLAGKLADMGFQRIEASEVHTIRKMVEEEFREYPVFLLTAFKSTQS